VYFDGKRSDGFMSILIEIHKSTEEKHMRPAVQIVITIIAMIVAMGCTDLSLASDQNPPSFDKPPEPVGGMTAIMQLVAYPQSAVKDGVEGRVMVSVAIDSVGHVKSVAVESGVRKDLNKAAKKAIAKSEWIPAQKDGRAVESKVIVPIQFKLEKKTPK
jgi:TonB family protein